MWRWHAGGYNTVLICGGQVNNAMPRGTLTTALCGTVQVGLDVTCLAVHVPFGCRWV